jgi:hypothetical protein
MKKILLSAIALFICGSSFAQIIGEKRHYFGFNVGAALPQGNFASTDYKNEKAGLAQTGLNLNLEGAGYFLPFVGIAGTVGAFTNSINADNYNSSTGTATVNKWLNGYLMAGPIVTLPLGKFSIDGKVLFGAVGTKTPNIKVNYTDGSSDLYDEKFVVNFGYNVGASVRYNLISKLALKLNCDYISSNQSVTTNTKYNAPGQTESTSADYTEHIDVRNINIGLGLVLQFVD